MIHFALGMVCGVVLSTLFRHVAPQQPRPRIIYTYTFDGGGDDRELWSRIPVQ